MWVSTPEQAACILTALREHALWGFDTEFDNVDISTQSTVARSRMDVFSIAIPDGPLVPGGWNLCSTFVLDAGLAHYPPLRELLEDPKYVKCVHNQPVDAHTLRNAGVSLRGGINTLSLARWLYPERSNLIRGNFDLHSLSLWRLGRGKTDDFDEMFGYDHFEPHESWQARQWCLACDATGCRKKLGHPKESRQVSVISERKSRRTLPLSAVRPGHPMWERYLVYAAADADLALNLYQCMVRDGRKERPMPWTQQ